MHDAAITAWSAKGCYDYVRPVSAVRAMADRGQSSDPGDPDCPHHVHGIEYIDDSDDPAGDGSNRAIDCVRPGDPLADDPETPCVDTLNVGKIKLFAWRGPAYISNSNFDFAGVGLERIPGAWKRVPRFREGAERRHHARMGEYVDASDQCSLSRIWGGIHPPADDIPA